MYTIQVLAESLGTINTYVILAIYDLTVHRLSLDNEEP